MTHSPKEYSGVIPELPAPIKWHLPYNNSAEKPKKWSTALVQDVAAFSKFLLRHPRAQERSEIIALGFWFRASRLEQLFESRKLQLTETKNYPTGNVFHIAPANVDTVFMYSVLLSALAGNQNIVRVSSRSGAVCWELIALLNEYIDNKPSTVLRDKIAIIEYNAEHTQVTELLSEWCDLRVVWGGNSAISAISAISKETPQVAFPDRFSCCLLTLRDSGELKTLATKFVADIMPFNQQACSSPKAVFWLDTELRLQKLFWQEVKLQMLRVEHSFSIADKVEQVANLQSLIMQGFVTTRNSAKMAGGFAQCSAAQRLGPLCKVLVEHISAQALALHTGHGWLLETNIESVLDLPQHPKLQTITSNLPQMTTAWQGVQAKRIATVGEALTFDANWDGIDLIHVFSTLTPPLCENGA